MSRTNNTYVKLGLLVLGIGITYFLATNIVSRIFVSMTKAAPATKVSISDSYVLGQKILAKADGKDKCLVNVFVMDKSGKGVSGKRVVLEGLESITAIKDVTTNEGKASFEVVSVEEGQFTVAALVEGTPLMQGVKVTFRN